MNSLLEYLLGTLKVLLYISGSQPMVRGLPVVRETSYGGLRAIVKLLINIKCLPKLEQF